MSVNVCAWLRASMDEQDRDERENSLRARRDSHAQIVTLNRVSVSCLAGAKAEAERLTG